MPHNTEYFEIDICYSHIYRRLTAFGSVDNRQLLRMHAMIDIRIFLCLSIHSENIWLIHHVSCMFFMKHKYMPRLFHTLCPWNYLFINRNIALWRVEQTPKLEPNKIKINSKKKIKYELYVWLQSVWVRDNSTTVQLEQNMCDENFYTNTEQNRWQNCQCKTTNQICHVN